MNPIESTYSAPTRSKIYQATYLVLTVIGSVGPWIFLADFVREHGLSLSEFFRQGTTNSIATAYFVDLLTSAMIFLIFAGDELRRLNISRGWMALLVIVTFGIGLSSSMPLFLFLCERHLVERLEGIQFAEK